MEGYRCDLSYGPYLIGGHRACAAGPGANTSLRGSHSHRAESKRFAGRLRGDLDQRQHTTLARSATTSFRHTKRLIGADGVTERSGTRRSAGRRDDATATLTAGSLASSRRRPRRIPVDGIDRSDPHADRARDDMHRRCHGLRPRLERHGHVDTSRPAPTRCRPRRRRSRAHLRCPCGDSNPTCSPGRWRASSPTRCPPKNGADGDQGEPATAGTGMVDQNPPADVVPGGAIEGERRRVDVHLDDLLVSGP